MPLTPCKPRSRSDHVRRLSVATVFFAVAVGMVVWVISTVILRDLSEEYLERMVTQAQRETEGFVRFMDEDEDAEDPVRPPVESAIDPAVPLGLEGSEAIQRADGRTIEAPPAAKPRFARPPGGEVSAHMSTWGYEQRAFLEGELFRREALTRVVIKYPGGMKQHLIRTVDQADYDPSEVDPRDLRWTATQRQPTSRPIEIQWASTLNGEPVQLEAVVDGAVVQQGIADLRHQVIPKLALGGVLFILLLVLAFLHVVRLIDRTRSLEARAAEQARLAEVGTMAAGLAHEIRNPLNAVSMNLQLFEEDLQPLALQGGAAAAALEPTVAALPSIRGEIERLGSLVSDFLTYARPAEPARAPRRMDEVVRECVDLFRPLAQGAGIELEADLAGGVRETLVDEAMIKQALTNVIVNAIEAVPRPGGHVRVETRCRPEGCRVRVLDDGPGLPEDVDQLFRVFHSTKKTGFGLGLAISRSRVEKHGGTLTARNRPAGGAEFSIEIPHGVPA